MRLDEDCYDSLKSFSQASFICYSSWPTMSNVVRVCMYMCYLCMRVLWSYTFAYRFFYTAFERRVDTLLKWVLSGWICPQLLPVLAVHSLHQRDKLSSYQFNVMLLVQYHKKNISATVANQALFSKFVLYIQYVWPKWLNQSSKLLFTRGVVCLFVFQWAN